MVAPPGIDGLIGGDGIEPGSKPVAVEEPASLLVNPEKRRLENILGEFGVVQVAPQEAIEFAFVAMDERLEGGSVIMIADTLDQVFVGRRKRFKNGACHGTALLRNPVDAGVAPEEPPPTTDEKCTKRAKVATFRRSRKTGCFSEKRLVGLWVKGCQECRKLQQLRSTLQRFPAGCAERRRSAAGDASLFGTCVMHGSRGSCGPRIGRALRQNRG
jgi:hypothetical protein